MRILFLILVFTITASAARAQKLFFVYIQAETAQPFFVKMNERVYSSSTSGYLILPKLTNDNYQLTVGFPMNKWPDQSFTLSINNRDHGFILKDLAEKGWGFFDLQTQELIISSQAAKTTGLTSQPNKDVSEFTEILARAADDPSLREKPMRIKESPKPVDEKPAVADKKQPVVETTNTVTPVEKEIVAVDKPVVKKETLPVKKENNSIVTEAPVTIDKASEKETARNTVITPIEQDKKPAQQPVTESNQKEGPVVVTESNPVKAVEQKPEPDEVYRRSAVTKKNESSTTEGTGIVYIDMYPNGQKDTIQLLIPNPKPLVPIAKEEPVQEKKFLDIGPGSAEKVETKVADVRTNSCNAIASESDFLKFRKRLASSHGDQEMLNEAAKHFKAKCYTTAQIKNLGSMFLNDGAKYKFYDAAYTSVTDLGKYPSLETELTDPYYVKRFRAILK